MTILLVPYRIENLVRKGEIASYKQFLLFSPCFPQLYIVSVSKCGIVWYGINFVSDNFKPKTTFCNFNCHSVVIVDKDQAAQNMQPDVRSV